MQAYRVVKEIAGFDPEHSYLGTQVLAHSAAKQHPVHEWSYLRVELLFVDDSKAGVLELLNGSQPGISSVLQTWALTPRGGLREVENGE